MNIRGKFCTGPFANALGGQGGGSREAAPWTGLRIENGDAKALDLQQQPPLNVHFPSPSLQVLPHSCLSGENGMGAPQWKQNTFNTLLHRIINLI